MGSTRCGEVNRPVRIAGRPQRRFDHGADGALPVGAGHVHEAAGAVRAPQALEQEGDPLQAELGGLRLVAEGVQESNGIGVAEQAMAHGTLARMCAATPRRARGVQS